VIPSLFAFRFEWPVKRLPAWNANATDWVPTTDEFLLNRPQVAASPPPSNMRLYVGWNPQGLGVRCVVDGLTSPPESNPLRATETDGLQVWIDTRNTQNVHRATRFCHHYCCLPATGKDRRTAQVIQQPIARAREEQSISEPGAIPCRSRIDNTFYSLEVWFPASVLEGFDPAASPKLGFYCRLLHHGMPDHFLTVGLDFPIDADPSLWQTLVLS
jgi:hypothetical protein